MLVDFVFAFALIGVITFILLSASSRGFFAEKDEETYEHGGITWVIHKDELPLTIEDLTEVDFDGYVKEKRGNESLLLGKWTFSQKPRMDIENRYDLPRLDYTICLIKIPALYPICKETFLEDGNKDLKLLEREYRLVDASGWDCSEVYQIYDSSIGFDDSYLLCYEDMIVEIHFNWKVTEEQKTIVHNKLNK